MITFGIDNKCKGVASSETAVPKYATWSHPFDFSLYESRSQNSFTYIKFDTPVALDFMYQLEIYLSKEVQCIDDDLLQIKANELSEDDIKKALLAQPFLI